MKLRTTTLAIALAVLLVPPALSQPHKKHPGHPRFDQMQEKVEQAGKAEDRDQHHQYMQEHVSLMQEQIASMRESMDHEEGEELSQDMKRMHDRIDNMERLLEQMIAQHQLMLDQQAMRKPRHDHRDQK